jgi:hypothetical protein
LERLERETFDLVISYIHLCLGLCCPPFRGRLIADSTQPTNLRLAMLASRVFAPSPLENRDGGFLVGRGQLGRDSEGLVEAGLPDI